MSIRTKIAATAFVAATALFTGVAGAAQNASGTWKPAADWNGLSPGSFKTQCEASGGQTSFEGGEKPLWSCTKEGSGGIYCDQGSNTTSTNCRRHTPAKFSRFPIGSPYVVGDGGVAVNSR